MHLRLVCVYQTRLIAFSNDTTIANNTVYVSSPHPPPHFIFLVLWLSPYADGKSYAQSIFYTSNDISWPLLVCYGCLRQWSRHSKGVDCLSFLYGRHWCLVKFSEAASINWLKRSTALLKSCWYKLITVICKSRQGQSEVRGAIEV